MARKARRSHVLNLDTTARHHENPDMVNHPPHYEQGGIERIVAIEAALTPEEFRGNIEDLKKAARYIARITGRGEE